MEIKLKVLHLITRLIVGGAQENTLFTAELLDSRVFNVDVICGPQTGPEGSLIEDAKRRNIRLYIEKNLVRQISPINDFLAFLHLVRILRSKRYQVVHTHSSKAGILGRWAAWVANCPVIIHTVHGWGFHDYQKSWLRSAYIIIERLTLKITDMLVAVTRKDIEKGMGAGIGGRDKYTLIRSGIELDRFRNPKRLDLDVRKELGIPVNANVVGTVTRLSTQKAPTKFLQVAARVLEQMPDTYFVMVGDGPLRDEVEKQAMALGIRGNVILTGVRRDVPELLQVFDVFILLSLWEGLPRVIPQAMAAGLPVIASNADGNTEIIKTDRNGILISPDNIEQAKDAVIQLLKDRNKRQSLAKSAQNGIEEYCVDTMVKSIASLYRNMSQA